MSRCEPLTEDTCGRRGLLPKQTRELSGTVACQSFADGLVYVLKNSMKKLLAPNISVWGRVIRAVWGAGLI
ncbi:MAG: hypothetical protein ACREIC_30050, partial [Limisphaerales bacterium]